MNISQSYLSCDVNGNHDNNLNFTTLLTRYTKVGGHAKAWLEWWVLDVSSSAGRDFQRVEPLPGGFRGDAVTFTR